VTATVAEAAGRAESWLLAHRNADGSWGYRPGQSGSGEPTLLAAAAGLPPPLDWLADADLGWTRLMGPVCLRQIRAATPLRQAWLTHIRSHRGTGGETAGSFDGDLPGWPWVEQTFSWVEPTAWGVLSLRRTGHADDPRVAGGLATLADRQCSDGGWNAGTPDILGQQLFGYLYLTGLVLVALPPGHDAAKAGGRFLEGISERPSPLNLAWATLARCVHGGDVAGAALALARRQQPDGGFAGRADRTALALSALRAALDLPTALLADLTLAPPPP